MQRDFRPDMTARLAGFSYLAIIILGLTGELAIRQTLIHPDDAGLTATNILASQGLFRMGIIGDAIMAVFDILLGVLLFWLLKPVNVIASGLALAFRFAQAVIIAASLMELHSALALLLAAGPPADLAAGLAALRLEAHASGYDLGLLFFGISSLFTGYLLMRATFFPTFLGLVIGLAGMIYIIGTGLRFLAPNMVELFQPAYGLCILAELAFCLWLLFRSVDNEKWWAAEISAARS